MEWLPDKSCFITLRNIFGEKTESIETALKVFADSLNVVCQFLLRQTKDSQFVFIKDIYVLKLVITDIKEIVLAVKRLTLVRKDGKVVFVDAVKIIHPCSVIGPRSHYYRE